MRRLGIPQIDSCCLGLGGLRQLFKHKLQHALHLRLRGQAFRQAEEGFDRASHVLHGLGQFAHFADAAGRKRRSRKVEACDAQAALAQQIDAASNGVAGGPA
ncbi:hypothetical protein SDC9_159562 [bioreactor metagenome]|uniref:Uncharacterized protein n=1 Tax=bioreactor metagenome TaxID=1076179 RepID=A0A645FCX8_9ZZZZ